MKYYVVCAHKRLIYVKKKAFLGIKGIKCLVLCEKGRTFASSKG